MKSIKYVCLMHVVVACLTYGLFGSSGVGRVTASPSIFNPETATLEKASYRITLVSIKPLRLSVSAEIPIDGKMLEMDDTYPAELPDMAAKGWPALISNLAASDSEGKKIELSPAGDKGWQLSSPIRTRLHLSYDIDYSLFASNGWSSPMESAFVDEDDVIVAGRSVFITAAQIGAIDVKFETPKGWITVMPWSAEKGSSRQYGVRSKEDLTNNMLVFSKNRPDVVRAGGFQMQIVSMGHWRPIRPLLRDTLKTIIRREVELMHYIEKETYSVVLLPIADQEGNAFRESFVYCFDKPSKANRADWGNTLAHEIFHYWNYARLVGASYASSQWFQEGFTEYVANMVMVNGKIIDHNTFISKLTTHVNNYRKLTTTLENYGTHKGPPLYSAGALVAFIWDLKIRKASAGKRNIGDLFRNLMTQTDSGWRKYTWADIKAALHNTATGDWEGFYQAHIRGHEPLPLDQGLSLAGLRLSKLVDGSEKVDYDPSASLETKSFWKAYIGSF
jgi:predicted metalloprotease with PDZ domain